ncbi:hypothetical protein LTR56_023409 [Elasticomyces elasticus]|nr:hypothetical protein LTR56_023409 [Elasticomyces elasticus]KAK3622753.1 hypothetical protein LTR22_024668 [Elasticomyces elasticus]KAK4921688.1 hypothetical protein LTR49_010979 [Elasticomyces elasticus]KAK5742902.1 hypothetical protein LTS12_024053 [Elasticomyces elasticus]
MHLITSVISTLALSCVATASNPADIFRRVESLKAAHQEKRAAAAEAVPAKQTKRQGGYGGSRWLTNATQKFAVNGTGIPDVPFDIGESYAGLLPISGASNETRELYFWFFPSTNPDAGEEITIWLNGGPGCSSLSGLLTENGPFTWEAGTLSPVQNPYTWVNLTNMIWIEQPVGVGFSQGTPNITNEVELGEQFTGFFKQFTETFATQEYDIYVTGESYAGYYVPYIADAFITLQDSDMPLAGIAINDPIIGDGTNQQMVVQVPYVDYWQKLLYLNESFIERIHARQDECGYTDYLETYLTYPPPQTPFPTLAEPSRKNNYSCDQFDSIYEAILEVNPCFVCIEHLPHHRNLPAPLVRPRRSQHASPPFPIHPSPSIPNLQSSGDYIPTGFTVFFNRTDVQAAINAPVGTNWAQCNNGVFLGSGDQSLGPAQNGVLQRVIEYTNNTIIGSGNLDMLLNTNGTLLAIQNMTWNGLQGLQSYPDTPFYVPYHPEYNGGALSGAGIVGSWGYERGVTFYQVQLAGHELPGFAPGAGYRSLELLLGKISSLGEVGDFTTQMGNFTGYTDIYRRADGRAEMF